MGLASTRSIKNRKGVTPHAMDAIIKLRVFGQGVTLSADNYAKPILHPMVLGVLPSWLPKAGILLDLTSPGTPGHISMYLGNQIDAKINEQKIGGYEQCLENIFEMFGGRKKKPVCFRKPYKTTPKVMHSLPT